MKKAKLFGFSFAVLGLFLALTACGGGNSTEKDASNTENDHSVAMVTDVGGVDDESFNQSAWTGLEEWGKEHDFKKGVGGYDYIQSTDASEYVTNIDTAVSNGFKTVFGIGYLLSDAISAAATANPDNQFGIIDSVIEGKDNVVSATFKDQEAAYLAGVAAAYTTKTDKVGFIGGEEGAVIDRFEAGFRQGVVDEAKELGKDITVQVEYAASFGDPSKGKALAASMYQKGVDIIFHASGATGQGIFQEAKALNEAGSKDKVWVIGVDSDQEKSGEYKTKDGQEDNFTLASTIKGVGTVIKDISNQALEDKFPGGQHLVYGLKDGGVSITEGNLSEEAKKAVNEAKEKIIEGTITVPEEPKNVKE